MYILDGSAMTTKKEAYEEIRTKLEIGDYMGNNLDALMDVLTTTRGEVRLIHACSMLNALGRYGCRLLEVFFDAAEENEYFVFRLGSHAE
ncbi:MAG: barstar family protein [Clostridia bacterium]|nr:barstar family protein [Clostridia bacterium]